MRETFWTERQARSFVPSECWRSVGPRVVGFAAAPAGQHTDHAGAEQREIGGYGRSGDALGGGGSGEGERRERGAGEAKKGQGLFPGSLRRKTQVPCQIQKIANAGGLAG